MYKEYIKEVANFPIDGVSFKDISPLLANPKVFRESIQEMGKLVGIKPTEPPYVTRYPENWIAIDARGFLFASALSYEFGGGVVLCRKKGKLPPPVEEITYQLEYGTATLEMKSGSGTAVIVDDVLATGGTITAVNYLANNIGYDVIDNLVLIDLKYVPRVDDFNFKVKSLIQYE